MDLELYGTLETNLFREGVLNGLVAFFIYYFFFFLIKYYRGLRLHYIIILVMFDESPLLGPVVTAKTF